MRAISPVTPAFPKITCFQSLFLPRLRWELRLSICVSRVHDQLMLDIRSSARNLHFLLLLHMAAMKGHLADLKTKTYILEFSRLLRPPITTSRNLFLPSRHKHYFTYHYQHIPVPTSLSTKLDRALDIPSWQSSLLHLHTLHQNSRAGLYLSDKRCLQQLNAF